MMIRNRFLILAGVLSVLLLVFQVQDVQAQETEEISIPLTSPGKAGRLKMQLLNGSITVNAYSGKEVLIKATARNKNRRSNESNETKNGLRKITSNGIRFTAEEVDNTVRIRKTAWNRTVDFEIKVPTNFSLELKTVNDGDIYVDGVSGQLEVSNLNGAITLENISGSVVADALNEDVKVSFKEVEEGESMAFSSLNGDLDVTFPGNVKASIKAKADNGNLYTDFDMDISTKKNPVTKEKSNGVYRVVYESNIFGEINGGGAEMTFKTFNGDIKIKKADN